MAAPKQEMKELHDTSLSMQPFEEDNCNLDEGHHVAPSHPLKKRRQSCDVQHHPKLYAEDAYFRSYEDIGVHRTMIEDVSRTNAYRYAIMKNYKLIYGKSCLDIGAGTGILSIFCAKAGAKKVYAVEASNMAKWSQKVVDANLLSERISVINRKLEETAIAEKVDVIVSEWMGYALLHESMLNTVIYARDNFLKPDGHMFPWRAILYLAPVSYDELGESFWSTFPRRHYEVNMACMETLEKESLLTNFSIQTVNMEQIVATPTVLCDLNLHRVSHNDVQRIKKSFSFDCYGKRLLSGFVMWFDVEFPQSITLSTSPYAQLTHWEQSVLHVKDEPVDQGTEISGNIVLHYSEQDERHLEAELTFAVGLKQPVSYKYKMDL